MENKGPEIVSIVFWACRTVPAEKPGMDWKGQEIA